MKIKSIALEIISLMIIMMMVYAVLSKFLAFHQFIGEINNQPLPNFLTPIIVGVILSGELLVSGLLLFDKTRAIGFLGCIILVTFISIYIIIVLFKGFPYVPCSCAGPFQKLNWTQHLWLNVFLILSAIAGMILQRQKADRKR